jgi:hypothetical protein
MMCESCYTRQGQPSLFEGDAECYLCGPCRKALAAAGHAVERMDLS